MIPISPQFAETIKNAAQQNQRQSLSDLNPLGTIDAIKEVGEIKKRREAENNYQLLTNQQKKRLDRQIANAKSEAERVAIITESLLGLQTQQLVDLQKRQRTQLYIFIGAASVFLITIIVLKKYL